MRIRRLVVPLLFLGMLALTLPMHQPQHAQAQQGEACFQETGFCVSGRIREFWEQNNGLVIFGFPISEQREALIDGQPRQVQWFERARLELHPENPAPFDVLLGRIGVERLEQQQRDWMQFPRSQPNPDCRYFEQTGHNVCFEFLRTWETLGIEVDGAPGTSDVDSLALFGLPLSDEQTEVLPNGEEYLVQWFERARLELHPENDPPNDILFGLLGRESITQTSQRCFSETGYCIEGRIREVWEQNNGADLFGVPISPFQTETIEGQQRQVQWFERARLELRPGNPQPNDVVLGRLGLERLNQQGRDWRSYPPTEPQDGCRYFPETRHNVCGAMLETWAGQGLNLDGEPGSSDPESLALFGLPLTEAMPETLNDGNDYLVQWFENTRLEVRTMQDGSTQVRYGPLGVEVYFSPSRDNPGEPAEQPAEPPEEPQAPPDVPQGARVAFHSSVQGNFEIYSVRPDGANLTNLTRHPGNDLYPSWSPDGQRLVFASDRDGADIGLFDLYIMNRDGSGLTRLTNSPESRDDLPVWSNDGNWIAFVSDRDGDSDIYAVTVDGSQLVRVTDNVDVTDSYPDWSPDDSQIVFMSDEGRLDFEIYRINRDGTGRVRLPQSDANEAYPSWSPDGTRILFSSGRDGNWKIYTMDLDGNDLRNLTSTGANDTRARWSPDGSKITFQSDRSGTTDIYTMNADGSDIQRITSSPARDASPDWSP